MSIAAAWSKQFGLALTPLFECEQPAATPGEHHILLDGGLGTFALSASPNELWQEPIPAAWAWSSDIPHHVTITDSKVAVLRWDKPQDARVFSRQSVERSLDKFYSYLNEDRLRSNKTVVDHLLGLFRRIRSLNQMAGLEDIHSTDIFTAALAALISPDEARSNATAYGLADDSFKLYDRLSGDGINAALQEAQFAGGSLSLLKLYPSLAIRHASGKLFQEAHFELIRAPASLDLFDLADAPQVEYVSRGGTHFTPPALARTVVEQTLSAIPDLRTRASIIICDPACGSGAFLHEALRTLRGSGFKGKLYLLGNDISPAAISMARFVLRTSLRDWTPEGGTEIKLTVADSLGDDDMPSADVILMNPPFIAFGAQTLAQREQLKKIVGDKDAARGDLSMAFVLRALSALNPNGVLGTLFPAGLLSSKSATSWRERLASAGDVRMLASIGDFGLFAHALVRIACLVIRNGTISNKLNNGEFTAVVTENDPKVTGEALRYLRKIEYLSPSLPVEESGWNIFPASNSSLKGGSVWTLLSPSNGRMLRTLKENFPSVSDLFSVAQGIQTGLRSALLLTSDQWSALPASERKYFRAATMSGSIQDGRVVNIFRLFFPHTANGPRFSSEDELKKALPNYFKRFLAPNRSALASRASIVRSGRTDWWGLMHPRRWSFEQTPRIISKFFAGEGGFVSDYESKFLPVTGHIWLPRPILTEVGDDGPLTLKDLLDGYVAIFNSSAFVKLLSFHSPYVAGGQFDLSWRHVSSIPVPNLRQASVDPDLGQIVADLVAQGRVDNQSDLEWKSHTLKLVLSLYGKQTASLL